MLHADLPLPNLLCCGWIADNTDEFPLPGAAVRNVAVEVLTERGKVVTFGARRQRRSVEEALRTADKVPGDASSDVADAPLVAPFNFIVTPTSLRWDQNRGARTTPKSSEQSPHVLFLGLVFFSKQVVTIDIDDMRLSASKGVEA